MPWQLLNVQVNSPSAASAEALLLLAGATAVSLRGPDDQEILEPEPGTTPLWRSVAVEALFPGDADLQPLRSVLDELLAPAEPPSIRTLADSAWRDAPEPVGRRPIGRRLLLLGAQEPAQDTVRRTLRLTGGMAFGTGRHPTTTLCLEWLDGRLAPGARLIDFGCGSGVLAIAALVLGASAAWAVDVEPQALAATRDNGRLNGLGTQLWIGSPEQLPDVEVDLVLANILARPLMNLAGVFGHYLRDGGYLVMSGVLNRQCDDLESAFAASGFCSFERASRGGWSRLTAVRDRAASRRGTD